MNALLDKPVVETAQVRTKKMNLQKRDKLCDLLRNNMDCSYPREVLSFQEKYPTVSKLQMEVIECRGLSNNPRSKQLFTESNFIYAINCNNGLCYGGGIELGRILNNMVDNKDTDLEETERCHGEKGSPKGRKRYGYCEHVFHIKIHVEYKDSLQIT